jgi:hypothetical protein
LDVVEDTVELLLGNKGSVGDIRLIESSELLGLHKLEELFHELIVHAFLNNESSWCATELARCPKPFEIRSHDSLIQIGVVEHNEWALAAKL